MGSNSKKNIKCHNQDKTRTSLLHLFRTYKKGRKQEAEKGTVSSKSKMGVDKKMKGTPLARCLKKNMEIVHVFKIILSWPWSWDP